jgi:hypothetical protein
LQLTALAAQLTYFISGTNMKWLAVEPKWRNNDIFLPTVNYVKIQIDHP